jgi:hypothetical protein
VRFAVAEVITVASTVVKHIDAAVVVVAEVTFTAIIIIVAMATVFVVVTVAPAVVITTIASLVAMIKAIMQIEVALTIIEGAVVEFHA